MNQDEIKKLYNTPANLRLKHITLCVIGAAIVIMISLVFLVDKVSWRVLYILRGAVGVLAIAFVIIVGVLVYRVNRSYISGEK